MRIETIFLIILLNNAVCQMFTQIAVVAAELLVQECSVEAILRGLLHTFFVGFVCFCCYSVNSIRPLFGI